MKTNNVRFVKFGHMKILTRCEGSLHVLGSIHQTNTGRITYHNSIKWNMKRRSVPARMTVEGFGMNGTIVSIISGYTGVLGEIITNDRTGRTIIWLLTNEVLYIEGYSKLPPMAVRYQAMQISAQKWFSARRST